MTNATIRFASGPLPDQRGRVVRYWTGARRHEFVEVATSVAGANLIFSRRPPNTVWVRMVASERKPGGLIVSRTSWLVPDAGVIFDLQADYLKGQL